ncbi:MAG: peptide chain release factor-like protein [Myxococcaceae bacterium]
MNTSPPTRDELRALARQALAQDDNALRAACEEEFFIASGPGGQHRNKTESGVRLTHAPTGISVSATERRSQAQNRGVALARLRETLAVLARPPPKTRRPTRPTRGGREKRLAQKRRQGRLKQGRSGRPEEF